MNVKVEIQCDFEGRKGKSEMKIPIKKQETIDTLLIKLSKRTPEVVETILDPRTGGLKDSFDIELNGRSIGMIKGMHTRLKEGDEVTITS